MSYKHKQILIIFVEVDSPFLLVFLVYLLLLLTYEFFVFIIWITVTIADKTASFILGLKKKQLDVPSRLSKFKEGKKIV